MQINYLSKEKFPNEEKRIKAYIRKPKRLTLKIMLHMNTQFLSGLAMMKKNVKNNSILERNDECSYRIRKVSKK